MFIAKMGHCCAILGGMSTATGPALPRLLSSWSSSRAVELSQPFKGHKLDPPPSVVKTSAEELLCMFKLMQTMRCMEVFADIWHKKKLIRGVCHPYDGQEAVAVGMEAALTKQDSIITSYGNHCQLLARGGTVEQVMAELFGRRTGTTKGLGGSMHMYNKEANLYCGCGIVGAQIPLGAGLAFAHKYRKDGSVAVAMYGHNAANKGQLYEALNISGLWDLPIIFVCEHHHPGTGMADWRGSKSPAFYKRGDYVPGLLVDGMDILAVKQAMAFAKQHVLANGPIILEMDTYRYPVFYTPYPGSPYRTRDEISRQGTPYQWGDPIFRLKKLLTRLGVERSVFMGILEGARQEVKAAVAAAMNAPEPPQEWLWKNIYVDNANVSLRDIDGSFTTRNYDPAYAH